MAKGDRAREGHFSLLIIRATKPLRTLSQENVDIAWYIHTYSLVRK